VSISHQVKEISNVRQNGPSLHVYLMERWPIFESNFNDQIRGEFKSKFSIPYFQTLALKTGMVQRKGDNRGNIS
jgi:hypothetical protein